MCDRETDGVQHHPSVEGSRTHDTMSDCTETERSPVGSKTVDSFSLDGESQFLLDTSTTIMKGCGVAFVAIGVGVFLQRNWHVARPDQFLVKTGLLVDGEKGMSVARKFLRLPGQQVETVTLTPRSLEFNMKCLSKQYLPFCMPVTYTVSPFDPMSEEVFTAPDTRRWRHGVDFQHLVPQLRRTHGPTEQHRIREHDFGCSAR